MEGKGLDMELLDEYIEAEMKAREWRKRADELRAKLGVEAPSEAEPLSDGRRRQSEALKRRWEEARKAGRRTL